MWAAVGIKHYIVAQGDSADEAVSNLAKILIAQYAYDYLKGRKPLADFSEAPSDYQKRFENASEEFKPPIPKVTLNGSLQELSGDLGFGVCDCKMSAKAEYYSRCMRAIYSLFSRSSAIFCIPFLSCLLFEMVQQEVECLFCGKIVKIISSKISSSPKIFL